MHRDELLALLRQRGGTRQTVIRVMGETVSRDDVVFEKETVEVEDEHGIRTVEWYGTRLCDSCGHALDQNTSVAGVCSACGQTVCSAEGCAYRCRKCGVVLCRRHARVFEGEDKSEHVFCARHAWRHRLVSFLKAVFA